MVTLSMIDRAGGAQLGHYYLEYTDASHQIESGRVGPLDAQGIPLADYDALFRGHPSVDQSRTYGVHYTPVTVAEYGLGLWSRYLASRDAELRSRFLAQADWFVATLKDLPGFGVWLHDFAFPVYNLEPPWVSAMAQGQGVSVLLRAFQLTGDDRYLAAATSAFGAFKIDIHFGGVSCEDMGYLWLEEFPCSPPTHVLNGFVYALWGVLDYLRVTNSNDARLLWDRGIVTIRANLHRYELAFWSRYDLNTRHLASAHYHNVHVLQLGILSALTGDLVLSDYHLRWKAYENGARRWRRWCEQKARGLLRRTGLLPRPEIHGVSVHLG